jgi:hypothetical protein
MNRLSSSHCVLRSVVVVVACAVAMGAAAADRRAERRDTFLANLLGEHVGTWEARTNGQSYRETLRIRSVQGEGVATVVDSFALVPDAVGWRWERRVRAGTFDRLERGTLVDGTLWRDDGDDERVALASVPAGTVLPSMRGTLVRGFVPGQAPARAFAYLDPSRLRVVQVHLEPCAVDPALPAATRCVAWRVDAPSGDEQWQLAGDGRVLRIEARFGGLPLRLDACDDDCGRAVKRPFDMIGSLVVASPYRISRRVALGKMRYILARTDGQPPTLARTGEQAVVAAGAKAVVTICRNCGTATVETEQSLAPYLRANPWVRSDDPTIRRLARRGGAHDRAVSVRMNKLTRIVRLHMREDADYIGYADAAQALRTGRGDCTEFAVLLAALARAQGIPARVAAGMAYSREFIGRSDTFNPHVWVQVYDGGRWVSYDAALEGFDSTHVALAVGTGEPQEALDAFLQLRQLRIERLGAVVR